MNTVQITNSPSPRGFPSSHFLPMPLSVSHAPFACLWLRKLPQTVSTKTVTIKAHVQFSPLKKHQVLEGRALVEDKTWLCSPLLAWSSLCSLLRLAKNSWCSYLWLSITGVTVVHHCSCIQSFLLFLCPMRKNSCLMWIVCFLNCWLYFWFGSLCSSSPKWLLGAQKLSAILPLSRHCAVEDIVYVQVFPPLQAD